MKKSPFVNRYYYSLHFGLNHGSINPSQPSGEANLDKILNISLQLEFKNNSANPHRYIVYAWSETYNMLRIYAGRGALLFAY
jgi:hypothetical protein